MLLYLALASLALYVAVVALVAVGQSRLVYLPDLQRELAATPAQAGLAFEAVTLRTADGQSLAAWWVPHPSARGAVIVFNGNAGNRSHRLGYARAFHTLGYATLLFDYRGYDGNGGRPSEPGTALDAEAAWRHLTLERSLPPARVVLLGESLGAAVAVELATRVQPAALVLVSAFTSVPDLGAEIYPLLPVRWLARIRYPSLERLPAVRSPVLVAHSPEDEIVPYAHGRRLYAAAPDPKAFLELAGGHNEGLLFTRQAWVESVARFIDRALAGS